MSYARRGKESKAGFLTCHKCGYAASRLEFKYLHMAASAGAATFRQCPSCKNAVYCDEAAFEDDYAGQDVWGCSALRGRVFTRKNRPPKNMGRNC